MLEIQALTYNDLPPVMPVFGRIPKEGGTVGRGPGNAVILPDPMKAVSRIHLGFSPLSGNTYQVTNISSGNPVFLNDKELDSGQKQVIRNGDRIILGGYVLEARYTDVGETEDPVVAEADLLPQPEPDFLAVLMPEAVFAAPVPELDDGNNPFAREQRPRQDPMQVFNDQGIGLEELVGKDDGLINGQNVDAATSELFRDPLADMVDAGLGIVDENCLDPLAFFGDDDGGSGDLNDILSTKKSVKPAGMDVSHSPELKSPFHMPLRTNAEVIPPPNARSNDGAGDDLDRFFVGLGSIAPPDTPLVSHPAEKGDEEPPPEPPPVVEQEVYVEENHVPDQEAAPAVPVSPKAAPRKAPPPAQAKVTPLRKVKRIKATETDDPVSAVEEELYAAFIEGLGIDTLPNHAVLDPDLMRLIGQLLRSYAQGTVDLIAARAVIKQEVRANVTLIAPERNNPLKFSPNANAALLHMLGQQLPGFLEPVESVQQAFVDLRAHQIGIVSGMQSALNHVLDRFNPDVIGDEPPRKFFDQLFAARHKARLWDAYGRYYRKTRESAADHFQSFFGAAFLAAYENAIAEHDGDRS